MEYYAHSDEVVNPDDEKYAKMDFRLIKDEKYVIPFPNITVEEYINKKNDLILSVENWLTNHCDIKIDLRLEEEDQKTLTGE